MSNSEISAPFNFSEIPETAFCSVCDLLYDRLAEMLVHESCFADQAKRRRTPRPDKHGRDILVKFYKVPSTHGYIKLVTLYIICCSFKHVQKRKIRIFSVALNVKLYSKT